MPTGLHEAQNVRSRAPLGPWNPLEESSEPLGYASFYLADPLARWPVRQITRLGDNKSDPNIETLTYGLFSTCEPIMRAGIRKHGVSRLFFLTRHGDAGERLVTGMYELGWWAEGPISSRVPDVAFAARRARFIAPIPLSRIGGEAQSELQRRFRAYLKLNAEVTAQLTDLVCGEPDLTAEYLAEIQRLEAWSLHATGYRYPTWNRTTPFSEAEIPELLAKASGRNRQVPNKTADNRWVCDACSEISVSHSLLKRCPHCQAAGTLSPATQGHLGGSDVN